MSEQLEIETRIAMGDNALEAGILKLGKLSLFTCPECHGTMLQVEAGDPVRFRCHTGHAYSIGALVDEVTESIEHSLWSSVRAMEELVLLLRHVGGQVREHEDAAMAARIAGQTKEIQQRIQLIRQALLQKEPPPDAAAAKT